MYEIEAKIPISKAELKSLEKRLRQEAEYLEKRISADTYYERPKQASVRIRQRGGETTFDLKKRGLSEGIESNLEMQWLISDVPAWKRLLATLGLKPTVTKKKKSELFSLEGFQVELNEVEKLGNFLEIETIVPKESDIGKAKLELVALFKKLGFSSKRFESKPYLKLLQNV